MDVEIHGLHRKSYNFYYEFPSVNTDLRLFLGKKFLDFIENNANFFLGYYTSDFEKKSVEI